MKAKIKFLKSAYVTTIKPRNWIKLIFYLSLFSRFLYRHRGFDRDFLPELLVTSCFDHAWKIATYFLSVSRGWVYFLHFSGKRRYLLLDRLINVQYPELAAKSIRTECPGKVKTSYSQYARNKVIRYFYHRFGHVFVEKKLWKCLESTFLILKILTRSGCTFIQ